MGAVNRPDSPLAPALLKWQRRAGRHDLPWQHAPTPYRVWVSEIMLQQTQVATVIPYYRRFLERFPDVQALAAAASDEVLHLWSGLGYYARARNLQRAARQLCAEHGGEFPREFAAVAALPGIGRSTAGAILALSRNERHAILDGNARRVLTRYFAVAGVRGEAAHERQLWQLAQDCTPTRQVARYTQGIMDLGATLCRRRQPRCEECPLAEGCAARRSGRQHELPALRRRLTRGRREVFMVVALAAGGDVLLERRPESGVWGGLWCLPQFASSEEVAQFVRAELAVAAPAEPLAPLEHAFTHFDLRITPLLVRCAAPAAVRDGGLWYNIGQPAEVGLPAPVSQLLAQLARGRA
jgi:A/G-specific adenine glycosylase